MGMDVSGKKPTSEAGEYFRNNVWWWRPLWIYCTEVAPDLTSKVKYGQTNDGDGLNASDSQELARRLREEIESGRTLWYEKKYKQENDRTPDEPCSICGGTGKRLAAPEVGPGTEHCNGCNGKGKIRPWSTEYPFSVDNVKEFAAFLEGCGGFEIW